MQTDVNAMKLEEYFGILPHGGKARYDALIGHIRARNPKADRSPGYCHGENDRLSALLVAMVEEGRKREAARPFEEACAPVHKAYEDYAAALKEIAEIQRRMKAERPWLDFFDVQPESYDEYPLSRGPYIRSIDDAERQLKQFSAMRGDALDFLDYLKKDVVPILKAEPAERYFMAATYLKRMVAAVKPKKSKAAA